MIPACGGYSGSDGTMKLRSLLFAPGDSERKTIRALESDADLVILDLEDSVAPSSKADARTAVAAALTSVRPAAVRVNPQNSAWYLADLAAIVPCRPHAIMLPKCGGPADLAALDHHLEALETAHGLVVGAIGVLALVTEQATALGRMEYAGSPGRLWALCFGAEDLAADLGVTARTAGRYPAVIAAARTATLLAAAQAGVPAIDTPFPDPRDASGLATEAAAAADGFAGKLCIHPGQIEAVAAAFTPAADRVTWARRVVEAFAREPAAGVLVLDGAMIDRPHLNLANRILASI